jgi:hypothetical protein
VDQAEQKEINRDRGESKALTAGQVLLDPTRQLVQIGRGRVVGEGMFLFLHDHQFLSDAKFVSLSSYDSPIAYNNVTIAEFPMALPPPAPARPSHRH